MYCSHWFNKATFSVKSNVKIHKDDYTNPKSMALRGAAVYGDLGVALINPLLGAMSAAYHLNPNLTRKEVRENIAAVGKSKAYQQITADDEKITVLYNGMEIYKYKTDNRGSGNFPYKGNGVYTLIGSSDKTGLFLKKDIFLDR